MNPRDLVVHEKRRSDLKGGTQLNEHGDQRFTSLLINVSETVL